MKLTELFKTGTGLPSIIKAQQEVTTQLSRQIEGTQGPLANVLATPILGDGKLSRTTGMNSTPQAQRIQKQHSPITTRVIGKKEAALETGPLYREFKTLSPVLLPSIVYSATQGTRDKDKKVNKTHLAKSIGVGAGSGLAVQGLHRLFYPGSYGPNKIKNIPLAFATTAGVGALFGGAIYGVSKSTSPLADKLLYESEKHNGNQKN